MTRTASGSFFFVGPSGIGKSTVVRELCVRNTQLRCISLDSLAYKSGVKLGLTSAEATSAYDLLKTVGRDVFFLIGLSEIYKLIGSRNSKRSLIIDVGAAFQNVRLLSALSRIETVICLYATPDAAYQRYVDSRGAARTLSEHEAIEFSKDRRAVYESAQYRLDTTSKSLDETVLAVECILNNASETK